nr:LysR family transcriptional regulator [Bradyrhizobium sp. KB893862 SZCCT0404]
MNDMQLFVGVVEHKGFSTAARALNIPKSRLSRRIAQLEQRLGTRLLQRSSRSVMLTAHGQDFYEKCQEIVHLAGAAYRTIRKVAPVAQGTLRVSCPITLAQLWLTPLLPSFLKEHPLVRIELKLTNRRVNPQEEPIDLAIRVRQPPVEDSSLVARNLGTASDILVASPQYLARADAIKAPDDISRHPTLSIPHSNSRYEWTLHRGGERRTVPLRPRLIVEDLLSLKQAALDAVGIAALPRLICVDEVNSGELEHLLPQWEFQPGYIQAMFASRSGMPTALRVFLDYLGRHPPG